MLIHVVLDQLVEGHAVPIQLVHGSSGLLVEIVIVRTHRLLLTKVI